jgi:hypothetical protein
MKSPVAIAMLLAGLFLGGCSTDISVRQPISADQKLDIVMVEARAPKDSPVPIHIAPQLETALCTELGKYPAGGRPTRLVANVTRAEFTSSTVRFFTGAFGGSNRLYVVASLYDVESGQQVGDFAVDRESNPGGYGAFYDQEKATIGTVAEAIATQIYGPPPSPPAGRIVAVTPPDLRTAITH